MRKRLTRQFYIQPTLMVAQQLLGKYLVRKIGKKTLIGRIIETEAYIGPHDRASHSYQGKITQRNKAEYLIGGHIYIYLVYGMYWQLNISTFKENKPECVLIRALEPVIQNSSKNNKYANFSLLMKTCNGPGKLCRWLKLNKSFYAEDLTKSKRIWLEDWGDIIKPNQIMKTSRIGIDYAGPYWSKIKWRFVLKL